MEFLREGCRILFSRRPPLSDQPLPMPYYTPSSIRGKALEQEFQDLLLKQAIEQAPQTRLLQSPICGPEGFTGMLSPGVGQAPSSVRGAGTTSHFQEVVPDPISGRDLSPHADPVSSVRCITDRDKGRTSPQDHRGVSFVSGPPSSSLASSSGPPFVPYSPGEGWDVKDAVSPVSPQVQVVLPRRIASHPLGSSLSGGSFMVVLGASTTRGRRSFPPSARLELLLGRFRRRLGRHLRGKTSVRSLDCRPEGTLHQPQGDDGSTVRPSPVGSSPPVAGDHGPVRDLADSEVSSVPCSSVEIRSSGDSCIPPTLGQPSGICFSSKSHHKESSSQTESLSHL